MQPRHSSFLYPWASHTSHLYLELHCLWTWKVLFGCLRSTSRTLLFDLHSRLHAKSTFATSEKVLCRSTFLGYFWRVHFRKCDLGTFEKYFLSYISGTFCGTFWGTFALLFGVHFHYILGYISTTFWGTFPLHFGVHFHYFLGYFWEVLFALHFRYFLGYFCRYILPLHLGYWSEQGWWGQPYPTPILMQSLTVTVPEY